VCHEIIRVTSQNCSLLVNITVASVPFHLLRMIKNSHTYHHLLIFIYKAQLTLPIVHRCLFSRNTFATNPHMHLVMPFRYLPTWWHWRLTVNNIHSCHSTLQHFPNCTCEWHLQLASPVRLYYCRPRSKLTTLMHLKAQPHVLMDQTILYFYICIHFVT